MDDRPEPDLFGCFFALTLALVLAMAFGAYLAG